MGLGFPNLMKVVEQNDVRKAFQVGQPGSEFRKDLDGALNPRRACGLNGHPFDFLEGAVHDANRLVKNIHSLQSPLDLSLSC
jgi:hypothetical protein